MSWSRYPEERKEPKFMARLRLEVAQAKTLMPSSVFSPASQTHRRQTVACTAEVVWPEARRGAWWLGSLVEAGSSAALSFSASVGM